MPRLCLTAAGALLLAACAPHRAPDPDTAMPATANTLLPPPRKDIRVAEYGAKPHLIDPAKGIYRFSNGVCRYLDREVTPWKVRKFDVGESPDDLGVYYHARNADFGIPEPPGAFDPIYDRRQHYIDVALTDPRLGGGRETAMRKVLADPSLWRVPVDVPIPYSTAFDVHSDNGDAVMFVNRDLQAAVLCDSGINLDLPNPSCQGMVWFDEREFAMFKLNYKALAHLDGIARSVRQLATTLRAECPAPSRGD